jgi:hypothetical protein
MDGIANATTEPEIKITAKMIEAGRDEIERVWGDFVGPRGFLLWDSVLRRVFLAMMKAT